MTTRPQSPTRCSAWATLPLCGAVLLGSLDPRPVAAATLSWTGLVSQFAEAGGNWSPVQVPAAGDDLVWSAAGGPYVQFGVPAVQSSRSWAFTGEKQIHTSRAHTVTGGIRLTGFGALRLSTIDSIVVNGDIENEGLGAVTIQSGCPVVGVDSVRFNGGSLSIIGLNSRLLARYVLLRSGLSIGAGARLVASQSLALIPGAQVVLAGSNSSITAPELTVPFSSNVSLFEGRMKLNAELLMEGGISMGNGALVGASTVRLAGNGSVTGHGTLAAPFVMEGSATALTAQNGKLTVGAAANPAGVVLDGTLQVNSGSELECLSASPVTLPANVTVNRGTLRSAAGFVLGDGAYMLASGTIAGDMSVTGGELSVLSGFVGAPKQLILEGNWSQGAAARRTVYLSESGGTWEADSLVVTGQAEPGGTLDIYYDEFVGTPANPIPFLLYSSRPIASVFDAVTLNGVPVTNELQIVYHADRAEIVFGGAVAVDDPGRRRSALGLVAQSGRAPALVLSLPADAHVTLRLFDAGGREAARVHEGRLAGGTHRFTLPGAGRSRDLAAGVYFARAAVRAGNSAPAQRTAKLVVQR